MLHAFTVHLCVSSPSSLPIDPDVAVAPEADAAQEPDDSVADLALAAEQPGKPPLEHFDIAYSYFSCLH